MRRPALILCIAAAAVTGCGDDDDGGTDAKSAATPATTTTTAAPPARTLPKELAGTWRVDLKKSELKAPPDGLTSKAPEWVLRFSDTGGDPEGPSMTLNNDDVGEIINPITFSDTNEFTVNVPLDCRVYEWKTEETDGVYLRIKPADSTCGNPDTLRNVLETHAWRLDDA